MEICFKGYARLVVAVFISVSVLACQQPAPMTPVTDKSEIVGTWEADGVTVEIFEDGRIIYTDRLKKQTPGRYEFIDNSIIRIEYEGLEKQDYKASVFQTELLVTGVEDSSTARLRRVK
jgi:hypothetical protein